MQNSLFTLALGGMLTLGMTGAAVAQDNTAPPPEQGQQQGRGPWRMDPDQAIEPNGRTAKPDQAFAGGSPAKDAGTVPGAVALA